MEDERTAPPAAKTETTPNDSATIRVAHGLQHTSLLKHGPQLYGDNYRPAFFAPPLDLAYTTLSNEPASVAFRPSRFEEKSVVYHSVPTEETSIRGRQRRKKQRQNLENETPYRSRPFNYMSALCGGSFPSSTDVAQELYEKQSQLQTTFHGHDSDITTFLQQLLAEEPQFTDAPHSLDAKDHAPSDHVDKSNNSGIGKNGNEEVETVPEDLPAQPDRISECIAILPPKIKRRRNGKDAGSRRRPKGVGPEGRSSRFRGVTKHRRSGRWEAHIWIKEMGRQVYLGGYEKEDHAAEAYDVAAIKSKGDKVKTNFDLAKYQELRAVLESISMDELVMIVRRQSQGFSRGTSVFRGVTHHPSGRWEARIGIPGRFPDSERMTRRAESVGCVGSKHIYLGLYDDEFEAASWYDRALVRLRGPTAATNFLLSNYRNELSEYRELRPAFPQGDEVQTAVEKLGLNFEQWVKHGRGGDAKKQNPLNVPSLSVEQHLVSQFFCSRSV